MFLLTMLRSAKGSRKVSSISISSLAFFCCFLLALRHRSHCFPLGLSWFWILLKERWNYLLKNLIQAILEQDMAVTACLMHTIFTLLGCRAVSKLLEVLNVMNISNKVTPQLEEVIT